MGKELLIIIPASYLHGSLNLYLYQLQCAEIEYRVIQPPATRQALSARIDSTRKVAQEFSSYERLICSDAFDVTFYGTKQEVLGKMPPEGVLQAAEKNCWPEGELSEKIEGATPWRFVNGGLCAGTPSSFLAWCDEVESHPEYDPDVIDQLFFNRRLAEKSPLCVLDSRTELFFCLYKGYDELQFDAGHPVNTLCDTRPNFIHANGNWEHGTMMAQYLESIRG